MLVLNMIKSCLNICSSQLKSRKGLDKPIFLIASLTLAVMFLMAYYLATTGWIDGVVEQFNSEVSDLAPDPSE